MVSGLAPLRDVFQRFAAKPLGNLGQRESLRIGKPQPHRQMASQNPILCDQVLVAEQQIPTPSRTPGGLPSGIDRAWWNVHHNDSRSEIILRSGIWLNGNYEITLFLQTELRVRSGILCKLSFGTLQAAPNLGFASIEAAAQIYAGTREAVEAVLTDRCD
jgi:hypothetical protein